MSEITTNESSRKQKSGYGRPKKHSLRIDMTPMVDLGFLLITFFIFTSTMSQPVSMNLYMPDDSGEPTPIKESGALTLIPSGKGIIYYYEGKLPAANLQSTTMKGIRELLINKKKRTPEIDLFVVIKPLPVTDYSTVVDILDEMTITGIKRYAISDVSKMEKSQIK